MIRFVATLSLLTLLCAPAIAGPARWTNADSSSGPRQRHYWMSQDFQRLVFWHAPAQGEAPRR